MLADSLADSCRDVLSRNGHSILVIVRATVMAFVGACEGVFRAIPFLRRPMVVLTTLT